MKPILLAAALLVSAAVPALAQQAPADPQNTVYLDTKDGRITIRLRPDLAPKHVERIKTLTQQKFYDGVVFHRVMEGFMAQTGDPTGTGTGGSPLPNLNAEFSKEPFKRGSVGMARSQSPNSANSQFFLCYDGCGSLTGQYTLLGEVVAGQDVVDKIKKAPKSDPSGTVPNPDKIVRMRLATEAQ